MANDLTDAPERIAAARLVGKLLADPKWRSDPRRVRNASIVVALPQDEMGETLHRADNAMTSNRLVTIFCVEIEKRAIYSLEVEYKGDELPPVGAQTMKLRDESMMSVGQMVQRMRRQVATGGGPISIPQLQTVGAVSEYLVPA